MNNYLIIGSNSFSGQSFTKYISSKKGINKIICISRSANKKFSPIDIKKYSRKIKFFRVDLNQSNSINLISKLINRYNINLIVNFTSQSMVAESWASPLDWYQTNVISTIKLVEFLKNHKKIKKFIHFSTPEVYGSQKMFQKESFSFSPSTPYAISRACSDYHLKLLHKQFKFPVIFTRASNVYGEYQDFYRLIPKAFLLASSKKNFPLHGSGLSKRNFIHIDDVSKALYKIIKKGKTGDSYHISSNNMYSIKNIVEKIYLICGLDPKKYIKTRVERLGKDKNYKLDSNKLRRELNWNDKISLEMGLNRFKNWFDINNDKNFKTEYIHKK